MGNAFAEVFGYCMVNQTGFIRQQEGGGTDKSQEMKLINHFEKPSRLD
jgi:hypothetical protein